MSIVQSLENNHEDVKCKKEEKRAHWEHNEKVTEMWGMVPPEPEYTQMRLLCNLLLSISITPQLRGYAYLREAVKRASKNPLLLTKLTKGLYPCLAEHFCTTAVKVERDIRNAISIAWARGHIEALNAAFGCVVAFRNEKPTNGQFIAMLAERFDRL